MTEPPVEITPAKALFFIANNFSADNVDIVFRNGASTIVAMFGLLGVNHKSVTPEDRVEANKMAAAHGRKGPHPDNPFVPDAWRWVNSRTKGLLQRAITSVAPTRQSPGDNKMPSLKVPIKQAAKLLEQLGYLNVKQMKPSAILVALTKLDETADAAAEAKATGDSLELLKKIKVTIAKGEDIALTNETVPGTATAKKQPDTKTPFPASDDDDEEDDDDEDDDDEDDEDVDEEDEDEEVDDPEPEAKPAKKPPVKETKPSKPAAKPAKPSQPAKRPTEPPKPQKSAGAKPGAATSKPPKPVGTKGVSSLLDIGGDKKKPKTKGEPVKKPKSKEPAQKSKPGPKTVKGPKLPRNGRGGRPGVYAIIVEELGKASAKRPATEDSIMKVLKVKCKDRKADSMLTSLKDALRRTIKVRYKLPVKTNDKGGWWIEKLPA